MSSAPVEIDKINLPQHPTSLDYSNWIFLNVCSLVVDSHLNWQRVVPITNIPHPVSILSLQLQKPNSRNNTKTTELGETCRLPHFTYDFSTSLGNPSILDTQQGGELGYSQEPKSSVSVIGQSCFVSEICLDKELLLTDNLIR